MEKIKFNLENAVAMTREQIEEIVVQVRTHESNTKTLINMAAKECLLSLLKDGNVSGFNGFRSALTPANRAMVTGLIQDCTEHKYITPQEQKAFDKKANRSEPEGGWVGMIGGKDETLTAADRELKARNLQAFFDQYEGEVFQWYSAKKEQKHSAPTFNPEQLAKVLAIYAASNGGEFGDAFNEVLENAKTKALTTVANEKRAALEVRYLTEIKGLSKDDAQDLAKKRLKDGKWEHIHNADFMALIEVEQATAQAEQAEQAQAA